VWKDVLETYRCLVSAKKNMPGMRIEDLFGSCTTSELEQEYKFLQQQAKDSGYIEDNTGPRGQYGGHRE
jgi:hypothetical protein